MMKKTMTGALIMFAVITAKAQQQGLKFMGGFNVGIPAHNLSGSSIAVGVDLMAHYMISKQAAITGDIGYTGLFAKNGGTTTGIIPLRAGIRFYPSQSFFVGAKFGAGFLSGNGSITTTAYSFGIGTKFSKQVELGASYDGYNKNGSIGLVNLRLAYWFR